MLSVSSAETYALNHDDLMDNGLEAIAPKRQTLSLPPSGSYNVCFETFRFSVHQEWARTHFHFAS